MYHRTDSKPSRSATFVGPWACALVFSFLLAVVPNPAEACVDYETYLHWVGVGDTPGNAHAVAVSGDYAFVADWNSGLQVFNVSDVTNPEIVVSVDTPGNARHVAISDDGNYAFIADDFAEIQVVDISDLLTPELVHSVPTSTQSLSIAISGNYAFVCDGWGGFFVIDITDPPTAFVVAWLSTGLAVDVALADGFAYIANGDPGFRIIDVSEPTDPRYEALLRMPGFARGVAVAGNYAYVAVANAGLQVVNITNREEPALVTLLETPDAYRVTVSGNYAYVADWTSGLLIVDISDPASPVLLGSVDSRSSAKRAFVQGDIAFVAVGEAGLQIVDVSNPNNVGTIGSLPTEGHSYGLDMAGDMVYVADGVHGLKVVSVAYPESPADWGSVDWGGDAGHIVLDDHSTPTYAYVGDLILGFVVVNVAGDAPEFVTQLTLDGSVHGLAVDGDYAFVGDAAGLKVVNISDPPNPRIEASAATPQQAWGVTLVANTAYVAVPGDGLWVFDVTNPATPVWLRTIDTPGNPRYVAVAGDYAFVGDHLGLAVVDISDGEVVAYLETPGVALHVTLQDDLAYVTDFTAGLVVIDVSNPLDPTVIGNVDSRGAEMTMVSEDFVCMTDYTGGLQILPTQCRTVGVPGGTGDPMVSEVALSFRNPTNPNASIRYRLSKETIVTLRVFDTAGRLVRVLENGVSRSGGEYEVIWDGNDDYGIHSPSGVYFYRLEGGPSTQTRKVTLLR